MEFVLVFVFAFTLFVILIGIFASSTMGLSERAPQEAAAVLDVVTLHASTLARLDANDEVAITFDVAEGALSNAELEQDGEFIRITRDGELLASRTIPGVTISGTTPVVGSRTIRSDSGAISLA